jgi:hypothetical protein
MTKEQEMRFHQCHRFKIEDVNGRMVTVSVYQTRKQGDYLRIII